MAHRRSALALPQPGLFGQDLETLNPGRPDEEVLGVTYDDIDDLLEGKPVDEAAFEIIVRRYALTAHKRRLPTAP